MGLVLPPIEAYQVQHLPIVKQRSGKKLISLTITAFQVCE
jgi:hypothetical protein